MKFKKDGKVFEGVVSFRGSFCCNYGTDIHGNCVGCPIWQAGKTKLCEKWISEHPAEAARLMGCEVIPGPCDDALALDMVTEELEREANMDKQSSTSQVNPPEPVNYGSSKPRICEVLGVEVEEKFRVESDSCIFYPEAFVDEYGIVRAAVGQSMNGTHICQLISGELHLIRKPRFTEAEVAFAKAMYAVIPDGVIMRNSANRLSWDVPGHGMEAWDDNRLPYKMFPSILPGQSVKLSDIVGGDTE